MSSEVATLTASDSNAPQAADLRRRLVTVIEPTSGWRFVDWKELREYRSVLVLGLARNQGSLRAGAIGIGWAIIQPVFSMVVFTIVFGRLRATSNLTVHPMLCSVSPRIVPWTYFSNALTEATNSLAANANMLRKIYFPRMLMPMSAVFAKLIDFAIAMLVLSVLMACYGRAPGWGVLLLPLLVLLMVLTALGLGMWLAAFAVQYRDVKHAMTFLVQMLMYAAPVVYPASLIPRRFQLMYALNPMVGVIEGFRTALLGTRDMPWQFLALGTTTALVLAVTGTVFFRRRERIFADVA